jgi:glycosyltransferase involved in cell wall biosynthesis
LNLSVTQIISTGGFYGAERVLLELALFLKAEGHDCRVAILDSPGAAQLCAVARERGLVVEIIPGGGMFDRQSVARLRSYLEANKTHIAHSHGYKSDLWLWLAARRGPLKVATAHAWYRDSAKLRFYERLDKLCLRSFAHVVTVSTPLLANIRRSGIVNSSLIENGLSLPETTKPGGWLRREFGIAPEAKILVRVGRMDGVKGNNILLGALARVSPDAHLLFVGEGPDEPALKQQAQDLGLAARVTFAGYRDDVADILRASDLFASPSLSEGLPMVLLEAMAARLPVVTTNVGAIGTIIRPGHNGWLTPPGDENALAEALNQAIAAPETARAYAEQAWRDYAADYSREAMGRKYLGLYERLLGSGRKP